MITETTSLNEIRRMGLEALMKRLGPMGMIRFLQQFETGYGDYTAERESWLTEMDMDKLLSHIQQQRQAKAAGIDTLKAQFHQAMLAVYENARQICNYNAARFYQMVLKHGGLETARRLLSRDTSTSGLKRLWECGRLDISMEAQVLKSEFTSLFSETELEVARDRLAQYGYKWDET
jgi:hypothetical protein